MEFPSLGKNCAWLPCKELDFLPLTCSYCNLEFCKNHISADQHNCSGVQCEKTNQVPVERFYCSFEGCSTCTAVKMTCPCCQKHFCLEHRHHGCFEISQEELDAKKVIWSAPKEQFAQSISEINKIVNEGIKKSMQNPKKQEAAKKINLMRLKAKSQGPNSIPTDSRIYFSVILPKCSKTQTCKPIFTSKDWSVGRVIDSVSDICSVTNKNNVANEKKVRLFKKSDGLQISTNMAAKMDELISTGTITNGETLILEYVNPEEDLFNYRLENFHEYVDS